MTHSPLIKFIFSYDEHFGVPLVPITFFHKNGNQTQLLNNAILDSGAYEITVPKALADILGVDLRPRSKPVHTAGGLTEAYSATIDFTLGRGGRYVKYTNVDVCVMKQCPAVLIGIRPIFEDYTVTILAHQQRCILEPKK
jgi:hypothetical protein